MATDQATADYEAEQQKREQRTDEHALERSPVATAEPSPTSPPLPVCAQCVNWQAQRWLHLADGTTRLRPGYCGVRAAADLPQISQDYAKQCSLYEEYIPF